MPEVNLQRVFLSGFCRNSRTVYLKKASNKFWFKISQFRLPYSQLNFSHTHLQHHVHVVSVGSEFLPPPQKKKIKAVRKTQ